MEKKTSVKIFCLLLDWRSNAPIDRRNNFLFHKERGYLDIPLLDETGDESYLKALKTGVKETLV